MNAFGDHIKRLRRARGLTQERLAVRCGLSPDTIRRLEHSAFSPSLETLIKLADGLALALSTLFLGFELGQPDGARELADLLATRPARDYRLAYRMLRVLFDELDELDEADEPDDEPESDEPEPDETGEPE